MENFLTIKEAAKKVKMTSETLRHYDRIGLVKPCYKDEKTGYRYYSENELVQLQTIELIKTMDLTLMEIKDILEENQLSKIIDSLKQAEKKADEKITSLKNAKKRIKRAYTDYENKLNMEEVQIGEFYIKPLPERIVMLSDKLDYPTTTILSHYHNYFYDQIEKDLQPQFKFEDLAGIYTSSEKAQMFAVCSKYPSTKGLTVLSKGNYLCTNCTAENKDITIQEMLKHAEEEFHAHPKIILQFIVVTGVLQWNYQLQTFID